ncbi:MAG: branched-chain amino acid transporter permease [Christensenellales bacterium]|jgi:branched-subunit amino acid transport protein AzlD
MTISVGESLLIILVVAAITFFVRLIPFLFFSKGKSVPKLVDYLGAALPPAVMAMLVVFCLRNTVVTAYPFGLPELIGVVAVVLLHVWKRNNLLSIFGGTAIYMALVQLVFV